MSQSKAEDIDLTHNYQIVTPGGDLDGSISDAHEEDDQDQAESFRVAPKKLPNDNRYSQYFNKKTIPELDEGLCDSDIQAANMKYYQGVSMADSDSPHFKQPNNSAASENQKMFNQADSDRSVDDGRDNRKTYMAQDTFGYESDNPQWGPTPNLSQVIFFPPTH